MGERTSSGLIAIHTSDRYLFKRCRRRWNWNSVIRMNLIAEDTPAGPLWFGTGLHFALEDFHGYNRFGDPRDAFLAFIRAHKRSEVPEDWEDLRQLGEGLLGYYVDVWLPRRKDKYHTLWIDGVPQVEVKWEVPIPGRNDAAYAGKFDRIVEDQEGRLWILDWKTTARYDLNRLALDQQISAYAWAGRQLYGDRLEGVLFVQFIKTAPALEPARLVRGGFSKSKTQPVSYGAYRRALIKEYGNIPDEYVAILNELASHEDENGDQFIRWDEVHRSPATLRAESWKIQSEVAEMLDPDLQLYPHPTRDCTWDCPFRTPCIALDDGVDVEWMLQEMYKQSPEERDVWKARLKYPEEPLIKREQTFV